VKAVVYQGTRTVGVEDVPDATLEVPWADARLELIKVILNP
jgi:Alcohol dehydrogenase GroES-associated